MLQSCLVCTAPEWDRVIRIEDSSLPVQLFVLEEHDWIVITDSGLNHSASMRLLTSIESIMGRNDTEELILRWSRGFRADELTVEDIEDHFATLDVSGADLAYSVRKRIIEAQRELDAIRWGMCKAGQRVGRIFAELERLLADHKTK